MDKCVGDVIDLSKPARTALLEIFADVQDPAKLTDRVLMELWARGFQVIAIEKIDALEAVNEELIRGMTEMAERYTARMDGAGEQITHLKAVIGQIENTLLRDSAAKDQAGNIDKRNFVGQAILLCRKAN